MFVYLRDNCRSIARSSATYSRVQGVTEPSTTLPKALRASAESLPKQQHFSSSPQVILIAYRLESPQRIRYSLYKVTLLPTLFLTLARHIAVFFPFLIFILPISVFQQYDTISDILQ